MGMSGEAAFEQKQLLNACYIPTVCSGITFQRGLSAPALWCDTVCGPSQLQETQAMAQFCTRQRAQQSRKTFLEAACWESPGPDDLIMEQMRTLDPWGGG